MNRKKDWNPTTKRFVAYIDIMGFKDRVARSKHEDIYQIMDSIYNSKVITESAKWNSNNEQHVSTTMYSDSIIVYSKDDSFDSVYSLVCSVSLISNKLFTLEIPHKGAIAFGEMTFEETKSIFFGQPIIDAYLLQEEVAFYGIIFHSTAESLIKNIERNAELPFLMNYPANFKGGDSVHLTVYPMYLHRGKKTKKHLDHDGLYKDLMKGLDNLKYLTSGLLRRYVDNTIKYTEFVLDN